MKSVQKNYLCDTEHGLDAFISIRKAVSTDIDHVLAIERLSFASPWTRETLASEIAGKEWSRTVVATLDDAPRGFMIYWMVLNEMHLLNLAVHPDYRRTGIATQLLTHLTEVARVEKILDVFLEVRVSNRGAQFLYRKFGFKPIGIRQQYYSDNGEDAIVMCRRRAR
jgi:[ribosomal protein S18]-alanine N-acetyltransferase